MDSMELPDVPPEFGKEMREKEFTLRDDYTYINHGSYGVVPKRIQEIQQR